MKNVFGTKSLLVVSSIVIFAIPLFAFGPFQVQYTPTQFTFYQHLGFDRIRAQNFVLQGMPGSPELPVKYLHYIIPPNMNVTSVRILSRNLIQIPTRRYIYPAQPSVPLCSIPPWVPPNPTIYNSDSLFPNRIVEVANSGIFDGARLVTIAVYPVQYRAQSRRLYVTNNISFEFELVPAFIPARANIRGINGQKVYDDVLKATVENDADIPLYYQSPTLVPEEPPEEEAPAQYTIIDKFDVISNFQLFADWLTDKGVPASIVKLRYILETYPGKDDAEKVRNFIINAYKNCGTIWVLLGGDARQLPFRLGWGRRNTSNIDYIMPSDLYFSDLNGNWDFDGDERWGEPIEDRVDIYPEVFVGRILTHTTEETDNWVNKILHYEKYGSSNLNLFEQTTWIYDSINSPEPIQAYPLPETRALFPSYFTHHNFDGFPADVTRSALDDGVGIYNIYCHGWYDLFKSNSTMDYKIHEYWPRPPTTTDDGLNNLNNENRYYIVYSVSCLNAGFDSPRVDTTIADAFTTTYANKGAVAFLGNARYGWIYASPILHKCFCKLLFSYDGPYNLGCFEGLSKVHFNDSLIRHGHNLFGSPEMTPWINYPGTMFVDHPTSIPVGEPVSFTVRVRTEGPLTFRPS